MRRLSFTIIYDSYVATQQKYTPILWILAKLIVVETFWIPQCVLQWNPYTKLTH
jgi:hypothetical protein